MVLLANPNFPLVGFEVDFTSGPPYVPGNSRKSLNATYRKIGVRSIKITRGRQYELDQATTGTLTAEVLDPFELLNPDNTASPFNTGNNTITPYRDVQCWVMWPNQPGTGNIINTTVNSSYDPGFELNPGSSLGLWVAAGGTTTLAQSTAQAFQGTHSLLVTQSGAGPSVGVVNVFPTAPGLSYTFSTYAYPTGGCSVSVQVVDALGVTHTSGSATTQNTWTRLSVTWNTVDAAEVVTIYGAGVSTPTYYVDATQLEFGATASGFTTTGPTLYPLFTGYVESWPTTYDMAGFRAVRPLACVDPLAILARATINQSYDAVVAADTPSVYLPWSMTTPPTSASELSGNNHPTTISVGPNLTLGNKALRVAPTVQGVPSIFAPQGAGVNFGGDTQPDSTPALSVSMTNANNPPAPGGANQSAGIDILEGQLSFDTVNGGMIECWVRPVAGVISVGCVYSADIGLQTNLASSLPFIAFESSNGSNSIAYIYNPDGLTQFGNVFGAPVMPLFTDGLWHYLAITISNGVMVVTLDGVDSTNLTVATPGRIGFNYICHISANCATGAPQSQVSFGRWAFYNYTPTTTQRRTHYQRGIGYTTELPGARVLRLLNAYWKGGYNVYSGYLPLANDFAYDPVGQGAQQQYTVLQALQEIGASERGFVWASINGSVIFEDRVARYTNGQTPVRVFGENPPGASPVEYPYEVYEATKDPTYVFSQANLSRLGNNNFPPVINTATQNTYGQRIVTQTVQANTDYDLGQAGIFYTTRYATAKTRVTKLALHPSANPILIPIVAGLEISQRHTVRRRNAGTTVSADYYIEKIDHQLDATSGEWTVDLQVSPVFVPSAWVLGDTTYGVLGTTTTPIY